MSLFSFMLTLRRFYTLLWCFHHWLLTNKCQMGIAWIILKRSCPKLCWWIIIWKISVVGSCCWPSVYDWYKTIVSEWVLNPLLVGHPSSFINLPFLCHPPKKVDYLTINQIIKFENLSIVYFGENESTLA